MIINNFDKLSFFIIEGAVYELLIFSRKKDGGNNKLIKAYFIDSKEYLNSKKEEIIKLCKIFNARAYLNLNGKDLKNIAAEFIYQTGHCLKSSEKELKNVYHKAFLNCPIKYQKYWIIDVDKPDVDFLDIVKKIGSLILAKIPTKNGYHVITKPFNTDEFALDQSLFYNVEIHKQCTTLLYYEESIT